MAGDRTLKLTLLAETKQLVDGLSKGAKSTESFGKQVSDISAKVIKSFALIGGAIAGVSIAFAKAAAEDQQAANRLAQTLDSVTTATNRQIAAVDQWVSKTSVATGIADDELRPAFERLARSTKSVEESQQLLNLALDLSAATGKPLEAVTNSLAKAYDGSYTSLQKLGIGIDANLIKAKDFDGIYRQLNSTFGEFSETRSEEAIVKFQRLQIALQEAKEAIGAALLPLFVKLGDWLLKVGVPNLNAFVAGFTGDKGFVPSAEVATDGAYKFGEQLKKVFKTVYDLKEEFAALATVIAGIWVAAKVASFITAVSAVIKAFAAWRAAAAGAAVATAAATGGVSAGAALAGAALVGGALAVGLSKFNTGGEGDFGGSIETGPLGNYQMSTGTILGSNKGGGAPTPTGIDFNNLTNTTKTLSDLSGGLVTSPDELVSRLTSVSDRISQIQFLYDTGQISKAKAQTMLDAAQKEFKTLEKIGNEFAAQNIPNAPSAPMGATGRGEYGNITINVMAPSVIDETGFSRAVQNAIQNAERRGTYIGGL